jgi:hypothetical protein
VSGLAGSQNTCLNFEERTNDDIIEQVSARESDERKEEKREMRGGEERRGEERRGEERKGDEKEKRGQTKSKQSKASLSPIQQCAQQIRKYLKETFSFQFQFGMLKWTLTFVDRTAAEYESAESEGRKSAQDVSYEK